jgi:hypothetical protein
MCGAVDKTQDASNKQRGARLRGSSTIVIYRLVSTLCLVRLYNMTGTHVPVFTCGPCFFQQHATFGLPAPRGARSRPTGASILGEAWFARARDDGRLLLARGRPSRVDYLLTFGPAESPSRCPGAPLIPAARDLGAAASGREEGLG